MRQKIAVVAAMIHGILFSLYGNCRDKIRALFPEHLEQSSKSCPLSLETPLSESFQCRQLFCKLSKIRQEVKQKLGFATWQ
jgi:hypothetical protein